jgi:uncharacterized protein YwqG
MLFQCEAVSNGVYTGGVKPDISDEERERLNRDCTKWQLLFQLDDVEIGEDFMLMGDGGRLYYYIKTDDLKNRNFDNCHLVLQCT